MFSKILIANRGEIACRIIKTCKLMGIKTVAVYSDTDKNSLHKILADESYYLGASKASESYLNHEKVIKAALDTGAEAIHPGYGFLSENYIFNKKVREAGLVFIGPEPEPMRILGSKVESRIKMMESNVPVVPGMKSSSLNMDEFVTTAQKIGYPVLIKASAGGGGKGMRVVNSENELIDAVNSAIRESKSAFGSDEVFLEKYIESPRHIEIQVVADKFGNAIHLFERECSIQRRHQKIIEESPSPALNSELRDKMGLAAINAIKSVNYDSLATVEFLLDKSNNFYFLEVNTRIQVEHPITEMVTGLDLVKIQIEIAFGNKLTINQNDVSQKGHAIECRIYAEDADNNFLPTGGRILKLIEPDGAGIRIDSGIKEGDVISSYYDPIMSKVITFAENREQARLKMIELLKNYITFGVTNSNYFLIKVLENQQFIDGQTFTNFITTNKEELFDNETNLLEIAADFAKKIKEENQEELLIPDNIWYSIKL